MSPADRRFLAPAAAAALLAGMGPGAPPASADAGARILSVQILDRDGTKADRPLDRSRTYRYRVRYRVGGAPVLRVGRALTLLGPDRRPVLLVRPPGRAQRSGTYTARGTLRLRRTDPTGLYRLRYAVRARDARTGDAVRRLSTIGLRFRNPSRA